MVAKKCICEICVCGRHRCPHRPHVSFGGNDKPCMLTEYATTYHQHPIHPRQSCKPTMRAVDSDAPIEDKTTNRVDYVRHPVERPYHHAPDAYKKPAGEHDLMTSYTKDYPEKRVDPAKAIRHDGQRQVQSKFEGEPTYTSDYRNWDMGKPTRFGPQSAWEPPKDKFEGQSTFTRDYRRYNEPPRQPLRPHDGAVMSDTPFDGTTGYREEYIRHPLGARFVKERETYKPTGVPMDGLTTFTRDFRGQPGELTKSFKPNGQAAISDAPFEDGTTFKNDYRKWPAERPYHHMPDQYRKPEGDMDMNTTNRITYKQHPLQRHAAIKPSCGRVMDAGQFEGITNYTSDFKPWEINRVHPTMRPEYQPNDAPFQGISTQKAHFIQHPVNLTHSFKPANAAMASGPFDDGTMYRMEYVPKATEPCPAAVLETARSKFTYVEQDTRGHKLYKPVFTSVTHLNGQINRGVSPQQLPQLAVA
ncbi:stabilizer of axonemal microtubules 2-like [Littorina saxatilis]|uniref:Stabilizer of axonemal microtubules 2 n=1 Tax=Littorina saxatilis TaxID=31220 RepID=A0AAN9C265_9CAEN